MLHEDCSLNVEIVGDSEVVTSQMKRLQQVIMEHYTTKG